MKSDRRTFITGAALAAGAGFAGGCAAPRARAAVSGAPMRDFACAPMKNGVRVGVVGAGARGWGIVNRLPLVPGVSITAVCDIRTAYAEKAAAAVAAKTGVTPRVYAGTSESYKALCDAADVDVVYNATSWDAHVPIALYALRAGKHALIEVPAAMTVEECWALVETAEAQRRHCLQLENCCYGETELLALNLCRLGMLGELLHGEGGYIHDRRWQIFNDDQWARWRSRWNEQHAGNHYSTHGLGPICLDMGINRGDRLDYLVSVDGRQRGYEAFAAATLPEGHPGRRRRFAMADMNVTTIRTAMGRTILLQHDVSSPRPYSRLNLISGTKGVLRGFPRLEIFIEKNLPTGQHGHRFDAAETARLRREFPHPLYRQVGEIARKAGGHGGMDFLMDLRWAYCLQNGLPMDTDVYDLAAWCAVGELTERSVRARSAAQDIPDFTRGAWRTPCRSRLMDALFDMSQLSFGTVSAAEGQLNV